MKKLYLLLMMSFSYIAQAQIVNLTPQAASTLINTNTTIPMGGNFKTYIVCSGNTLTYQENSTMDTIVLMPGATLKIDSVYSYGYSKIYAKAGSIVDINFKQVGSLIYEAGVTIQDTNVGPPSFFMGAQQVTTINVSYANLPGGIGCTPTGLTPVNTNQTLISLYNNDHHLYIKNATTNDGRFQIINPIGAIVKEWHHGNVTETIDISSFPKGVYFVRWMLNGEVGAMSFLK